MLRTILAATFALNGAWSGLGTGVTPAVGGDPILHEAIRSWYRVDVRASVEVWTNRDDLLRPGESVRVYFRSHENAYVTVFRVDTDGRVDVLFPAAPWENNYARGGRRYQIDNYRGRYAFVADEYPGQGYLFAVASRDPFNYAAIVTGDRWDYRYIAHDGLIVGDPYVALTELIDVIVPVNYADINYDIVPYYVERHYEYPRFLCYDCHAYAPYPYWDPYAHSCTRVRIVIYNDPYYYPVRSYGGPRVVYAKPRRLEPRYVIRDRVEDQPFVVQGRRRADGTDGRRRIDAGAAANAPAEPLRRVPTPSVGTPERRQPQRVQAADGRRGAETGEPRRVEPRRAQPSSDSASAARPSPTRRRTPEASLNEAQLRATPRRTTPSARQSLRIERDTGVAPSRPTLRRREPAAQRTPSARPQQNQRDTTRRKPQTTQRRRKP
jgi:hypothetical protein